MILLWLLGRCPRRREQISAEEGAPAISPATDSFLEVNFPPHLIFKRNQGRIVSLIFTPLL